MPIASTAVLVSFAHYLDWLARLVDGVARFIACFFFPHGDATNPALPFSHRDLPLDHRT
jgi:hypothetical protein